MGGSYEAESKLAGKMTADSRGDTRMCMNDVVFLRLYQLFKSAHGGEDIRRLARIQGE